MRIARTTYFILFFLVKGVSSYSQCSPQSGPPPSNLFFNTASNGLGGRIAAGGNDLHWTVSIDSIKGPYAPAVVMSNLPSDYYKSIWPDCDWISLSALGDHVRDRFIYYKISFNLPCNNVCGKSYSEDDAFCLSLDLFSDNSIYEIYVNGVAQSGNLGGIIPVANPFHAPGAEKDGMIAVSLCHNWNPGSNTIIVQTASSAPVTGMLVQASSILPADLSGFIVDSICQGQVYNFGGRQITQAGNYLENLKGASGCDSIVALKLKLKPAAVTTIDTTICQGQTYLSYGSTGTYKDAFPGTNGCDSVRTLHLTVQSPIDSNNITEVGLCRGDTLQLHPGLYNAYLWEDGSTKNYYTVNKTGMYTVKLTDACGIETKKISVKEKICHINFPNAFTPNNDGNNDKFKVLTDYLFDSYQLVIYNRWGQIVFETNDPAKGWDGYFKGNLQPSSSSYVYYCRFKREGLTSVLKGSFLLIL
jgi:gliding motility-associated-like protein